MTTPDNSICVPLRLLEQPVWGASRRREPLSLGVPLPRGAARSPEDLSLLGDDGCGRPLQVRPLDVWPDGSLRWALLDLTADLSGGEISPLTLYIGGGVTSPPISEAIQVLDVGGALEVNTGPATFSFQRGGSFPFSQIVVGGTPALNPDASGFRVGHRGSTVDFAVGGWEIRERGPLRAELVVRADFRRQDSRVPLDVFARVEMFAGSASARVAFTMRNPRRARHLGGQWQLGDPGSLLLDSASLLLTPRHPIARARAAVAGGSLLESVETPFEIYQDSSGGNAWNHRTHVNRAGVVQAQFRGYRVRTSNGSQSGLRASPVIAVETVESSLVVGVPRFWENCPRAVTADDHSIEVGFFPRQSADAHELQGGEQKTHELVVAFAPDDVSDPPLAWCHDPIQLYIAPEWCCDTGALSFVLPASTDGTPYRELVETAFDADRGFFAKQERQDEFGWRHFGDLPADHESAFQPADRLFVSHYNNQYDAVSTFAAHFFRSGDVRWWRLMDDLARHVRDIDIYHTREDKAAYNGGLFWHTQHYMDAGASTHRTYPRGSNGGGPSAEHNYPVGLMLHYFLTGDRASRDAAVGLARWVIEMDDGALTPFRWLASGATGHASATGSMSYHGPGRGPGNSLVALLVGHRLSGNRMYADKADELVRRCIHPHDDLEARNLLDVERRWYYTVFLQALGVYLYEKCERREFDDMYGYARASLLHYASWMAQHERPYLERPDVLEFPTETWVAQDLRKSEVLWWAAGHSEGDVRDRYVDRARFFFDYAIRTLSTSATRHFTRPMILVLHHGVRLGWLSAKITGGLRWPEGPATPPMPATRFEPQRTRAQRRARILAGAAASTIGALAVWLLGR